MTSITLENHGMKLDGVIYFPTVKKDKYSAILFVHGWTSEKARSLQYAQALADMGYICFLFDMRGHGTSEGDRTALTSREFLDDVVVAYDYLSKIKDVDANSISAIGSSFGGYLLALLCEKRKLKNLVLRAPADYPNEQFDALKARTPGGDPAVVEWRKQAREYDGSFALTALHHFLGEVLFIESENDDKVPHQTIVNFMTALPHPRQATRVFMKGAPHSIKEGPFRDEVQKILTEWFQARRD